VMPLPYPTEKPKRVLPARFLRSKRRGDGLPPLRLARDYAAFLALGTGFTFFFAFSLAANSCLTMRVIASVFTL
jgi:hypothetical protein